MMTTRSTGSLRAAYAATLASSQVSTADAALVQTGWRVVEEIEAATEAGGQEAMKSVYLTPHFLSVLRELRATPAARHGVNFAGRQEEA